VRILNYGSLNIDYVYGVNHIVCPGETLNSASRNIFAGGKGANQSRALANAGANVYHAGKVGKDGAWLVELLDKSGVDVKYITVDKEMTTGHAIIQVEPSGQNSIILDGGSNHSISAAEVSKVIDNFDSEDILLIQNEINEIPHIMRSAKARGMSVCFNPAPFSEDILNYPLECVNIFIVNETEGREISGEVDNLEDLQIARAIQRKYPESEVIMTLGSKGLYYLGKGKEVSLPAAPAEVVDTTAAGDTFIGYYLAAVSNGKPLSEALKIANQAAAISVSRSGAMESIPLYHEVDGFFK
jgi:ribokinase